MMKKHASENPKLTHYRYCLHPAGLLAASVSLGIASHAPLAQALTFTSSHQAQGGDVLSANVSRNFAMGSKQAVPEDTSSSPDARLPESTARFMCQFQNGAYTVMYQPESQPGTFYPWAIPQAMGGGWSADRRCAEISRRLEEYRPDGLLELSTSIENGYDIVCATTEQNPLCRIVFTVPQGQNPVLTRDRVFENLAVANSGQSTNAVNTFTGRSGSQILDTLGRELGISLPSLPGIEARSEGTSASGIDLRPFLDPADGGTGAQIQ